VYLFRLIIPNNPSPIVWLLTSRIAYGKNNSPQAQEKLISNWPYLAEFRAQNRMSKQKQKQDFDHRHKVKEIPIRGGKESILLCIAGVQTPFAKYRGRTGQNYKYCYCNAFSSSYQARRLWIAKYTLCAILYKTTSVLGKGCLHTAIWVRYSLSLLLYSATGQKSRFFSNFVCTPILTYKV
jgi:hypothetical protein